MPTPLYAPLLLVLGGMPTPLYAPPLLVLGGMPTPLYAPPLLVLGDMPTPLYAPLLLVLGDMPTPLYAPPLLVPPLRVPLLLVPLLLLVLAKCTCPPACDGDTCGELYPLPPLPYVLLACCPDAPINCKFSRWSSTARSKRRLGVVRRAVIVRKGR
jgi:hypothetical protein